MDNRNFTATGVPSFCEHTQTIVEHYKPGTSPHHGALKCAECGAFLRFVAKPGNIERWKTNAFRLVRLKTCPGLTPWERQFINSIAVTAESKHYKLSPAQQQAFDETYAKHFSGKEAL
jgi:hypothetical protein